MQVIRDGSLDVWLAPPDATLKGELPSPPLPVDKVEAWLRNFYPTYSNHPRCAMHIHMSFSSLFRYQQLMTPDYWPTIVEAVKAWSTKEGLAVDHPIWDRL